MMNATAEFHVTAADRDRAVLYYNTLARKYDTHVKRGALGLARRRERSAVLSLCELTGARAVIDAGCGSGFYALEAKRGGAYVCAFDAAPDMIEEVARRLDEAWVDDLESLVLKRTFDRVICAGSLDFVSNPESSFRNLCRLVAPGGRLVVLCPRVGLGGTYYRFEKWVQGFRVNLFRPEWLNEIASEYQMTLAGKKFPLPTNMALAFQRA